MARILVLVPRFPYPVIGGDRLRIYHICKELSKNHELTLLSICETREEIEMELPNDGVFKRVERILLPKWRSYVNCLFSLPTKEPLQVAYYSSLIFKQKVQELAQQNDIALAHLIRTGHYLIDIKMPKVLEMTDAISMNYERVGNIAKSSGFKNIIYSLEQKRLKKYEQQVAKKFDLMTFVSKVDKDYLFPIGSSSRNKVLVCSNGVSFDDLPYSYQPDGRTIVFIGNMTTIQNLDAARWFAKFVMPQLSKHGDYQFKIIGRIKEHQKLEFKRFPNTFVTGCVDSVAEAANGAIVGVCPMRLGAGVQNKVLEYMALGVPTITSSVGLEGIDAKVNKDILVADKVNEYISSILKISTDINFAKRLSMNGHNYVLSENTWTGKLAPYVQKIEKLLESKK